MIKYLTSIPLALIALPAAAQQWTVGDQGVNWNVVSTNPVGAAPYDAYAPTDPGLPVGVNLSDFVLTVADMDGGSYLRGTGRERKIRLECEPSPVKIKDNILGKGIAKFGHPHMGFGVIDWDENTTFQTIRANPRSSCAGGPIIAANYMEPALLKQLPSNAIVAVLPQGQINYYVTGNQEVPNVATWIRPGMQFLLGANPRDMNDTRRRAIYDAAGYAYPGGMNYSAGMLGWVCGNSSGNIPVVGEARMRLNNGAYLTDQAAYIRGPSGEDPWDGQCVADGSGPANLNSVLIAPDCWDRHNGTAPDGRAHFWYSAGVIGVGGSYCPTTTAGVSYGFVPDLEVRNIYYVNGPSDYLDMYFESDRMRVATTECPDATAPCDGVSGGNVPGTVDGVYYSRVSISPCRRVSLDFCNGETLHADYTFGNHVETFNEMQRECLGIPVDGIEPTDGPAECNTNIVSRYKVLRVGPTPPPLNQWITPGCTSINSCNNASPSNPNGRYRAIPGYTPGEVNIHSQH